MKQLIPTIDVEDLLGRPHAESVLFMKQFLQGAHYTNLEVRMNGKFYRFEGDFVKHLLLHVKGNLDDATYQRRLKRVSPVEE